jgi:hypothetical protein
MFYCTMYSFVNYQAFLNCLSLTYSLCTQLRTERIDAPKSASSLDPYLANGVRVCLFNQATSFCPELRPIFVCIVTVSVLQARNVRGLNFEPFLGISNGD